MFPQLSRKPLAPPPSLMRAATAPTTRLATTPAACSAGCDCDDGDGDGYRLLDQRFDAVLAGLDGLTSEVSRG